MQTTEQATEQTNERRLAALVAVHDHEAGPRVGDYVIWREQDGERVMRRVAHDWGDEVQTADGGSFHLGYGGVSFSGSLHRAVPKSDLVDTGETLDGPAWIWDEGIRGAGRGLDVVAPFRVFAYVGERRLRERMATWEDDAGATPTDYAHILHLYGPDGFELGNYPLDGYGRPVDADRAIRDWERLTGRSVIRASDVVTVQGQRMTHYGVRVTVLE